jgi:hypothetical protein
VCVCVCIYIYLLFFHPSSLRETAEPLDAKPGNISSVNSRMNRILFLLLLTECQDLIIFRVASGRIGFTTPESEN